MTYQPLKGQKALVTGASSGIGLGVARALGAAAAVRFGHDPRASALDVDCRAPEVDNLCVLDGSFFPSSAAVNPALTIMANALRVADHLKARLGA